MSEEAPVSDFFDPSSGEQMVSVDVDVVDVDDYASVFWTVERAPRALLGEFRTAELEVSRYLVLSRDPEGLAAPLFTDRFDTVAECEVEGFDGPALLALLG